MSKVKVCVDIWYSVTNNKVVVSRVQLSKGGSSLGGKGINVATMRGEAFFASSLCDSRTLLLAVETDLEKENFGLHKRMLAKWRSENSGTVARSLVDALNSQASPDEIAELISSGGRGDKIAFTYTKPNGEAETRHVTAEGVLGHSMRALDQKDGKVKNFRLDRITKARRS